MIHFSVNAEGIHIPALLSNADICFISSRVTLLHSLHNSYPVMELLVRERGTNMKNAALSSLQKFWSHEVFSGASQVAP